MSSKEFGDRLRSIRTSAGYSQEEAANLLLLSRSSYYHYEAGKRIPSLDVLIRMSAFYNINPLELLIPLISKEIHEQYPDYSNLLYSYMSILSPDVENLISNYHKLTKDEKSSILKLMCLLIKAHK